MARLRLGDLASAGPRALGRYTGTLLAVFVAQSLVAAGCMLAVAVALSQAFAKLPLWDEAVDGDLVALIGCLRHGYTSLQASAAIVFGAVLLWQVVSWFVAGGVLGVLANRPDGRTATARCFGASGAATFLAYARLALCGVPGAVIALFLLQIGVALAWPYASEALTPAQLAGPLALGLLPAAIACHVFWTIGDYARVELSLRGDSHRLGATIAYLRALAFVVKRPITLVHGALGWVAVIAVTAGYAVLAFDHPMYGAEGAVTLFVIRQGVALARTSIRFAVMAGQVELGKARPAPPRRAVEPGETRAIA